jgi:hypothetical protein
MHLPAAARSRAPYGLAFPVHELVHVRTWAAQGGLRLRIALDQVLDGAEFEELLILERAGGRRMTLWRTATNIILQSAGASPRAFTGLRAALDHAATAFARPPVRRSLLRNLLFWT